MGGHTDRIQRRGRFARWLDDHPGLAPKWRPRFVRVAAELPTTGTNKVVTRTLVHQKYRPDRCGADDLWERERDEAAFHPFDDTRVAELHEELDRAGRGRFWDL